MAKKPTLYEQYAKEYDRIRKQISRMEKRGYDVSGLKPERVAKKDITKKDVEKLRKLTNEDIYKKAGGESKKSEEASRRAKKGWRTRRRKEERKTGYKKTKEKFPEVPQVSGPLPGEKALSDEEEAAMAQFEEQVEKYNASFANKMYRWRDSIIAKSSTKAFARMVADAFNSGVFIPFEAAYDETIMNDLQENFLLYLPFELSEDEKEQTEDEWQRMVQESIDNEDFFGWD